MILKKEGKLGQGVGDFKRGGGLEPLYKLCYENGHKLFDEMGQPVVSLTKSQWKLRQQNDQNFPMEGKPLESKY